MLELFVKSRDYEIGIHQAAMLWMSQRDVGSCSVVHCPWRISKLYRQCVETDLT
jgi:hypothetical protein